MKVQRAEFPAILAGHEAARDFFAACFMGLEAMTHEMLWVAHVDDRGRCIHLGRYSDERTGAVDLPVRRIIADAARLGSAGVLLAHNHPSGCHAEYRRLHRHPHPRPRCRSARPDRRRSPRVRRAGPVQQPAAHGAALEGNRPSRGRRGGGRSSSMARAPGTGAGCGVSGPGVDRGCFVAGVAQSLRAVAPSDALAVGACADRAPPIADPCPTRRHQIAQSTFARLVIQVGPSPPRSRFAVSGRRLARAAWKHMSSQVPPLPAPAVASSPLEPMIRKLSLWKALGAGERAAVLALPHKVEELTPGAYVVREGQTTTSSCLLLSGFTFRQKTSRRGARSINAVHMPGDIVDLQNSLLGRADHSVQALTRATIARIPRDAIIDAAVKFPDVGMAMWYDTLVDASIFREWILNIARRDAQTRIAHVLCEFGVRLESLGLGERSSYEFPMTQEQLADACGLTPVHINRSLRDLEERGLITRTARFLCVADWSRLKQAGEFEVDYLHLDGVS